MTSKNSETKGNLELKRKVTEYKTYFYSLRNNVDHGMTNSGMTGSKLKLQLKSDELVSLIKDCDVFRTSFATSRCEIKKTLDQDKIEINDRAKKL